MLVFHATSFHLAAELLHIDDHQAKKKKTRRVGKAVSTPRYVLCSADLQYTLACFSRFV